MLLKNIILCFLLEFYSVRGVTLFFLNRDVNVISTRLFRYIVSEPFVSRKLFPFENKRA